jgi:hypothetical protein
MLDGQKEMHLSQVNLSFNEEYKRMVQARSVIDHLYQRMQVSLSSMPPSNGNGMHPNNPH